MALSSNSVLHYTTNVDYLISIIKSGFKATYCHEQIHVGDNYFRAAFPMVSFCDIPLHQVDDHVNSYGKFGIGLKKTWATQKGLNPVLYFDSDSILLHSLDQKFRKMIDTGDQNDDAFDILVRILSYSKNYEYDLPRKGIVTKDYRFYNEREWRYVPKSSERKTAPQWITQEDYDSNKAEFNTKLSHFRLTFDYEDISYIIVESESDVSTVVKSLREHFYELNKSASLLDLLYTKIMTIQQIREDF